jgi:DNA polymerase-3 subunit delta
LILQYLEELEAELNRGRIQPVYVVVGPEEYQCRQAVSLIKRKVLTPDAFAFNYAEFNAQETPIREAVEAANTYPMVSPRRLVLINDIDKIGSTDQEILLAYLEDPALRSVLILTAENLDRRTSVYKRLVEKACVAEFPKLKGFALERWAENFFRRSGFRISSASLKKIVDLAGEDMQSLANELEKLLIYAGMEKVIPDAAVDDLVSSSRQHTIFELTKALGMRDRAGALRQLGSLMDSGEKPLGIASMMARHFRQILIAKDLLEQGKSPRDAATAAQVPPYFLDEFMRHVRAIDWATVRSMYLRLAEVDYRFKSSSPDERMVLENLIYSL